MKDPNSMFMTKRLVLSEALSKHCVILAFLKSKSDVGRNEVSGRILPCHDLISKPVCNECLTCLQHSPSLDMFRNFISLFSRSHPTEELYHLLQGIVLDTAQGTHWKKVADKHSHIAGTDLKCRNIVNWYKLWRNHECKNWNISLRRSLAFKLFCSRYIIVYWYQSCITW